MQLISQLGARVNLPLVVSLACITASLVWIDSATPAAGLWALVILTSTVGFVHGALDIQLMQQRFDTIYTVIFVALGYLALVLLLTWLLSHAVEKALWLLFAMSAWHFGEPYARWSGLPLAAQVLARYVVGGAPIMLPMLISPAALALLLQPALSAPVLEAWAWLAKIWLLLVLLWSVTCGARLILASRYVWMELLGVLILNVLFSPVMAFALYFGFYHAPVHIWRVARSQLRPTTISPYSLAAVAAMFVLTLLLGFVLWQFLGQQFIQASNAAQAVQWLVVLLAALTLPHLVMVSLCGHLLSGESKKNNEK